MELRSASLLSESARRVASLKAGVAYAALVPQGSPHDAETGGLLASLSPETVLARPAASPADAACVLAGLWLWHDYLEESHRLSQDVKTPSGSYWHAIMHRREGDFWNSKYWLNRCPEHPAFAAIAADAATIVNASRNVDPRLMKLTLGDWDPQAFVDLVEAVEQERDDAIRPVVVELQRAEWRGLMDHCIRAAAGER